MLSLGPQLAAGQSFSLGVGDVVKIAVYGQEDLTTVTRISEGGMITFPLIGEVRIGGMSTPDAERKIERLLIDRGFVKQAQVSIFLEQRRQTLTNSVTILGQIARPGIYPLQDISGEGVQTVIDLLAMAGGTNEDAADHLYLMSNKKGAKGKKVRIDLAALMKGGDIERYNLKLNGGDIVLVPGMDVFYIYGQVNRPGRYRLERDMTVMQALSVGGGVTDRGSESGITVNRSEKSGVNSLKVDLSDRLQVDDVIYVKESIF
jgi:polysaccharide export outer membrane protein